MREPVRFQRASFFPSEWNETISEFLDLFAFHRYRYIFKPHGERSWKSATETWRLTDTEILKAVGCVHPKGLLGVRFGKQTRFAVIDIDAGSEYHNRNSFQKLKTVLANAGISKVTPFRSSDSNGWHIYIFFDVLVDSLQLRHSLATLLKYTEFRIKPGTLEVFPNLSEGSSGMGLRLPLQPGFAFLNEHTLEVHTERWELNPTKAIDYFMDYANESSNSHSHFLSLQKYSKDISQKAQAISETLPQVVEKTQLNNVVPITRAATSVGSHEKLVRSIFKVLPPGMKTEDWNQGREYHLYGLTGRSQRANAIYCLSHYLFYGDPSRGLNPLGYGYESEREQAIRQILDLKHNGFSSDISSGCRDAVMQIERSAHWIPPHRRNSPATKYIVQRPISWVRENANRKSNARMRIQTAVQALTKQSRTFTTVDLQKAAECSRTTLYKHSDLWREAYEELAEEFFASCTHEYNGVEGGSFETTCSPVLEEQPDFSCLSVNSIVSSDPDELAESGIQEQVFEFFKSSIAIEKWRSDLDSVIEKARSSVSIAELNGLIPILLALKSHSPDLVSRRITSVQLTKLRLKLLTLSAGLCGLNRRCDSS